MSDDYFGRLLARHVPPSPADPFAEAPGDRPDGSRRVLVQPRLPGPFERVEALRGAPAEPDEPAPLFPQAPRATPFEGERVRYEREIRTTDRETVLRTRSAREDGPDRTGQPLRPSAELLRPTAPLPPAPRPSAPDAVRPQRRDVARASEADGSARTTAAPRLPGRAAAPLAAAPTLRPRTDEVPAARSAARAAAGRRGPRAAERVVHVQIGRLEVSAAGPERPAADGRTGRAERRGPSMSLADYLARGERTT
ncbi:hypothetical protein [Streptomyces sp. NPDC017993]|uniref:hypothetical protein n=1 Tax=Streptomyces sp. NPDC017993 TaxID=3365027 RepID=UPI0037A15F38